MGVSTDGQICFGILLDEGQELPWDDDSEYGGDIDSWWESVNGYVNPCFNPLTEEGNYKPGVKDTDPRVYEYFTHPRKWHEEHPIPVEMVNCCSGSYPMWILAIPRTCMNCRRGDPESFNPEDLRESNADHRMLEQFCRDYGILRDDGTIPDAKWWLSSYWG